MKLSATRETSDKPITRNPERSRERILAAAFREFAAEGFAGARVDNIAQSAGINKRMLYHYFGDKKNLFREVLRRKMAERHAWGVATPDDPRDSLPYWFDLACKDPDWIRLLEWEALQFGQEEVIDETKRREAATEALGRIQRRQKLGHLSDELASPQVLLAMVALTWFPLAFPQLTRLITGQAVASGRFQQAQRDFLRRFATAFKSAANVAIIGCLIAALAGCSRQNSAANAVQKKDQNAPAPVLVARAEARDVQVILRNIGNVEAYATVTVRSQITGQIMKIHFQEGQEVKAGDMLFTIDPRPAEGALRHAQADLKRDQANLIGAKLEYERVKKLRDSSIASEDDYEKAESAYLALEATILADQSAISNATLNVEFTGIRSMVDGRTGNLMVKAGNIVKAPDDALVTVNQIHPIYVTFSVPEQDLPAIRRRIKDTTLSVEVEVPGDTSNHPRGELSFIDNTVDPMTGRIKLKATFSNQDNVLWPGQFVQTMLTVNTLAHATLVPSQAVQASQTGEFVYVVTPEATVQRRPIVVGLSQSGLTVIESGVKPGETVVTDGQLRLRDGAKVTIQTTSTAAASTTNLPVSE
jgi:multidrug efflux system membrane fusion protein